MELSNQWYPTHRPEEIDPETGELKEVKKVYPTSDDTYEAITENGETKVTKTGTADFQQEINSYREDTDINILISKYLAGDPNSKIGTKYETMDNEETLETLDRPLQDLHKENEDIGDMEFQEKEPEKKEDTKIDEKA